MDAVRVKYPHPAESMFTKILIADRGASAMRIARTCERLGIATVVLHGTDDREAAHVQTSDAAVCLEGSDPYGDVAAVVDAAKHAGVQAIHPGASPLAVSVAFARAAAEAGIVCVGPAPEVLAPFADRLETRDLARRAGVRVAPGAAIALRDRAATYAAAERLGPPLRVTPALHSSAAATPLDDLDTLDEALALTSREAERVSGDGRVYLERELHRPRHLQVQLVAAAPEDAVVLGDLECSARLDRLPLIVEQPAPALGAVGHVDAPRRALSDAARVLVAEAGFRGVATLGFLLDADGRLYFLGLDPRLGPEHALTEMRTSVDLVEEQLRIAAGEGLSGQVWRAEPIGHAMQARVCLEDPSAVGPGGPMLDVLRWPTLAPGSLRVETAWSPGGSGTEPIVAAVTAYQQTRHAALLTLDRVLAEAAIAPLATNLGFLRHLLGDDALRAGQYDVTFAPRLRVEAPAAQPPQASSVEPA